MADDDSPTVSGTRPTSPPFPAGSTMAEIQQKGKLVVGTKFDQPAGRQEPVNSQVEGFDVEIGKLIAAGIFGGEPSTTRQQDRVQGGHHPEP